MQPICNWVPVGSYPENDFDLYDMQGVYGGASCLASGA
jgi:hypothetical protein